VTLPDGGEGCASSGLVLPHWNGPHRVQPIRRDGRFTRSRSGDCTMKAVIATAQHMAATRMAKRVTGLLLSDSRSSGGTGLRLTSRAIGLARVRDRWCRAAARAGADFAPGLARVRGDSLAQSGAIGFRPRCRLAVNLGAAGDSERSVLRS